MNQLFCHGFICSIFSLYYNNASNNQVAAVEAYIGAVSYGQY